MLPWSVMAHAVCPISLRRPTSGPILLMPSNSEYSVWRCRWTKLIPGSSLRREAGSSLCLVDRDHFDHGIVDKIEERLRARIEDNLHRDAEQRACRADGDRRRGRDGFSLEGEPAAHAPDVTCLPQQLHRRLLLDGKET